MNRRGALGSEESQLQVWQKALRGEPHEHFRHEIKLEGLENGER